MRACLDLLIDILSHTLYLLSGEWLFTLTRRPNGGDMVLVRSLWITLIVYVAALIARRSIHPELSVEADFDQLRMEIVSTIPWLGAIFAGVYASLYTRFASQWMYLANLYNKIKETSVRNRGAEKYSAMAEWKAGFLEDAQLMHLATHRVFVAVVQQWGGEREVERKFLQHCPRGERRFDGLMRDVDAALQRQESKYGYKDWERWNRRQSRKERSSGIRGKSR